LNLLKDLALILFGAFLGFLVQRYFHNKEGERERQRREEDTRREEDKAREAARAKRINDVVSKYLGLAEARPPINSNVPGLIQAGIAELRSDEEAREVLEILERRAQRAPVRRYREALMDPAVDVLAVFQGWRDLVRERGQNPGIEFHKFIEQFRRDST
jgi:hypothetical protein